jgi:agmatinase
MPFDPNAAADSSLGVFGLPFAREASRVVVIPVPFEATVSYGGGTEHGPETVREASAQVDLLDRRFGEAWRAGIYMEEPDPRVTEWGRAAREIASPIIERGGAAEGDAEAVARVDAICAKVNTLVRDRAEAALREGRIPCVLGGEHAVSLGAIRACAEAHGEIGLLQIDAHMDLRPAFEGFRYSHASVVYNALEEVPQLRAVSQVGIRDYSPGEAEFAAGPRVATLFDDDLFDARAGGEPLGAIFDRAIEPLPERIYITLDIDGLDPALCPGTGTPVPGGLSFREASFLLQRLARSGRRVVGCDLVEVAPHQGDGQWNANVGARVLFRLCMVAIASHET